MKKFILSLLILAGISSFSFAYPMIQLDIDGPSVLSEIHNDCFNNSNPFSSSTDLFPVSGISLSISWDFDTSDPKDIHYLAGLQAGFKYVGVYYAGLGGFSYKLCDLGKLRLELVTTAAGGVHYMLFGGAGLYTQISADFILSGPSRRGFYGGLGLVDYTISNVQFFKDFGTQVDIINNFGIRAVIGIRF
ncbi:MAG: hypothetical protein MJ160_04685 [Treponema sp.]|nr:hypothetical protein [Treponema sp.]